ncbi:MAG: protein translocase subunit SecF [Planctomycetota bacterium]|nr:MAG: protein translocase subunit SecF [Planctomycetota bacterium]
MIIYYRWLGLVADVALLLNLLIILAVMALYHADLTLPVLAGILSTVGMSVDANILIFERIREELARGKTLRHAFRQGYDKAFWAIFDANITTLITAVVLFQIGTGPIKGFAVTLSVGILSSLFTALFVTKVIFGIVIVKGWLRKASMLSLLSNPSIPFMKLRRVGVMISLILIVAGMIHLLTVVRGSILGIDFTGGSIIQIKLNHPISTESMRQRVHAMGVQFEDAEVQAVHSEGDSPEGHREYQIRIPHIIKSTPPKIDSKTGQITFYFEIERGKVFPDTLKMLRDLAPRGIVQVLPLEERNSFNWRLSFTTKPLENPDLEVERYRSLIEEYLEGKNFKIVQAETQSQLLKAFAKDLAPKGFPEVKEPFVPYKDTGKGQIRFRVNLDATSSAKPEVIVSALLSESFLEVVNAEKKLAIKPFEREYVQVKVVGGNEYVKEFEILAGLITEREVPLYDAALRTYFKSNRTKTDREGNVLHFVVSEPFPRISQIGPAVAKSLKAKAFWSIVFSILVIIAYITVRFEFTFGIAAIIALIHDLLFTLGLIAAMDYYGILEIKINLPIIAAFLTILGYSLNDTIVIFDRIRENLAQRKRKDSYLEIIDSSLNQTLSRTLLTSFTTFIVVLILFLCGVKVIQGFAFALMVGVVVGTYSSLFIASPVVVFYHLRYERQREKQRLAAATAKKKKK